MPLIAMVAVAIDWLLGEPRRYHPLVGFGWLAQQIEAKTNKVPNAGWVCWGLSC